MNLNIEKMDGENITITYFDTPGKFFENNADIFLKPMEYYHLIHVYRKLIDQEQIQIFSAFNITLNEKRILAINASGNFLIYGNDWTEQMVVKLSTEINLKRFSNWHFAGNKALITELFSINPYKSYSIYKDRICYLLNSLPIKDFELSTGSAITSSIKDLEIISEYMYQYSTEEWGVREGHDKEYAKQLALRSILSGDSVHRSDQNSIKSIIQLIDMDTELPIIGSLYTPAANRCQGYGRSLILEITKKFMEVGYKQCGVISDATNLTTNRLFVKIGFQPVFNHIDIEVKG